MSAEKQVTIHGLLGKPETVYNGGGTLSTATDAILLAEPMKGTLKYLHDGERPRDPATGGPMRRNVQRGRWFEGTAQVQCRGAGAAYSATVLPRDHDLFLRLCGRKRVIDTTVNAEKVTYTLSALKADWASGVLAGYTRDEILALTGAYASEKFTIDGVSPGASEFTLRAAAAVPADAAVPAMTYQDLSVSPPIAETAVVNIGSYITPRVLKVEYEDGREISEPRPSVVAAGGILGFTLVPLFKPRMKITIESTALVGSPYHSTSGINPTELRERATQLLVGVRWGAATSYNQMERRFPNAQLVEFEPDESGPISTWVLTFAPDYQDVFEFLRGT